ncbi:calcium-dependent phosphotriesterase [Ramicandelaber brevisporus]|nr:calcium-dependent phosphotriesterase [Ramicandelaber brevisporus]
MSHSDASSPRGTAFERFFFRAVPVLAGVAAVFYAARPIVERSNALKTFTPSANVASCQHIGPDVAGLEGCEDVIAHDASGTMYLACGNLRERWSFFPPAGIAKQATPAHRDNVFTYDPVSKTVARMTLNGFSRTGNEEYRSHGIGVISDPAVKDTNIVMLVNHRSDNTSSIEIFRHTIGKPEMDHVETVTHPLLYHINSVVPLSAKSFYATSDVMGDPGTISRMLEMTFLKPTGYVTYRNEAGEITIAAKDIPYANGIASDPDARNVYVASPTSHSIYVYDRQIVTGNLDLVSVINTGDVFPDNVRYDKETGAIYTGGVLKSMEFFAMAHDPTNQELKCGWAAARFTPKSEKKLEWEKEYVVVDANAEVLSTVSVATKVPGQNAVLVGGVLRGGAHLCPF